MPCPQFLLIVRTVVLTRMADESGWSISRTVYWVAFSFSYRDRCYPWSSLRQLVYLYQLICQAGKTCLLQAQIFSRDVVWAAQSVFFHLRNCISNLFTGNGRDWAMHRGAEGIWLWSAFCAEISSKCSCRCSRSHKSSPTVCLPFLDLPEVIDILCACSPCTCWR